LANITAKPLTKYKYGNVEEATGFIGNCFNATYVFGSVYFKISRPEGVIGRAAEGV
jgi:hypothetical protein